MLGQARLHPKPLDAVSDAAFEALAVPAHHARALDLLARGPRAHFGRRGWASPQEGIAPLRCHALPRECGAASGGQCPETAGLLISARLLGQRPLC